MLAVSPSQLTVVRYSVGRARRPHQHGPSCHHQQGSPGDCAFGRTYPAERRRLVGMMYTRATHLSLCGDWRRNTYAGQGVAAECAVL